MEFETAFASFLESHRKRRTGIAKERLSEEKLHAEKEFLRLVWWPGFESFDCLHPEYEITDFRDGYRYLDFAYIQGGLRLAIEIDGMGPHWTYASKFRVSDQYQRQNQLLIDGWDLLRFLYEDVIHRPRTCLQSIQQMMGNRSAVSGRLSDLGALDREILRLIARTAIMVTPKQLTAWVGVTPETARKHLRELVQKGWLKPASKGQRIRAYRLAVPSRYVDF